MYSKKVNIDPKHIDCQNILDNIHYPYYYELVRHEHFAGFGKTVEELTEQGINAVLLDEHIKFKKPITAGEVEITNKFTRLSKVKFVADQEIKVDGKVVSTNRCEITCIPAQGGRPFFPEYLESFIEY
ncbi:acyl-CoA thioesterase [Francisella tularensis subsp. novicida]|uniref:acyl-CoA thioesterase n=1 Tax=Francisella tularensis TaxID=263 RepID=UPI0008FD1E24|nr:acyl-CoA thioesterase [Francisella tularensis]APC96183.1 thioesterase superfamily protein [Francisella tularensis subsp. novicida]MBK2347059.1 acyl-CoA thioesterase [Francisella tularensis subsp. novicida]